MDDDSYESIFVPIISKVMETFQPSAVVLQCGADSLTGILTHFITKSYNVVYYMTANKQILILMKTDNFHL